MTSCLTEVTRQLALQDRPNRATLLAAMHHAPMSMILTDPHQPDNPIIFANPAFERLSGHAACELIGRNCRFLQGADTAPETVAAIRDAIERRLEIKIDIVNYRQTGEKFVNELFIRPLFDSNGEVLYFLGSQVNVSAYVDARMGHQLGLIERERHVLGRIAEGIPLNRVLEDLLLGVEAQSVPGLRTSILFLSEDGQHLSHGAAPSLPAAYNDAIHGIAIGEGIGSCGTVASRGTPSYATDIATDPHWRDFRELALTHGLRACWSTPIKAADGTVLGTFANYYDTPRSPTEDEIANIAFITQTAALAIERHRHDEQLRRSEAALQSVNAELADANLKLRERVATTSQNLERAWRLSQELLVTASPDGTIESVNPMWTRLLGWDESDLVGTAFAEFVHPEDIAGTIAAFAEILTKPLVNPFEYRFRHQDGSYRWFGWTATFDGGKVYASGRHLTIEKEQADALRQSQKMEAVGQLTGGLAHDFNNLLAGISGSLELIQMRSRQGRITDVERYLAAAQGATRRASALTHRLLAFSRRQTLDPKPVNVDRLVANMEEMIQRTVGPAYRLEIVGTSGLWPAVVDASQLENALLNLCINARDAMPQGGSITIETANKRIDSRAARMHNLPEGQYLSLMVTDTGTGMPPEIVARVFEPFFTTKPIGEGTGLGLSMIYGFARQSGGQVQIYSEVNKGTTVCIYLPRHHGMAVDDEAVPEDVDLPRSMEGETVLVVDDEPTIRMLIVEILEDLGYTAIEAGDSAAGLSILQSKARIDLLVTDVGLPGGMNGRQMADAARVDRPGLKVLFITGYAPSAVIGNGQLEPGMEVLTKPFLIDAMATRIRTIIEANGKSPPATEPSARSD